MLSTTFWYGRCEDEEDERLEDAISRLKDNEWKADKPVYIFSNPLREGAALRLLGALKANTSAETFILHNVELSAPLRRTLEEVFEANSTLRKILLRKVRFDAQPFVVPVALLSNLSVNEISLERCRIHSEGCSALANMLTKTGALKRLNLRSVFFSSTSDLLKVIEAIGSCKSVEILHLERMGLSNQVVVELARAVASNGSLSTLSLRNNDFGADSVGVLMKQGLSNNCTLQNLLLSDNPIGDLGAHHIMEALKKETSCLRQLCLLQTGIGRGGYQTIAKRLASLQGVRRLTINDEILEFSDEILASMQQNMVIEQILEPLSSQGHPTRGSQWDKIDLLLRWNKANRRVLKQQPAVSTAVLPRVLSATAQTPDVLYQFVCQVPGLLRYRGRCSERVRTPCPQQNEGTATSRHETNVQSGTTFYISTKYCEATKSGTPIICCRPVQPVPPCA